MPAIPRTTRIAPILRALRDINSRLAEFVRRIEEGSVDEPLRARERREFRRLLTKLDQETRRWVEEVLPEKYAEASRKASKEAGLIIGAAAVVSALTARDLAAVARLQSEVQEHFDLIQRDVTQAVDNIIARGGSIATQVSRVQDLFDTATGTSVVRVNGRTWRSDKYARAVVVSRNAEISREAAKNPFLNNGVQLVRVNRTGSTHDKCRKWEGAILSITGAPETIDGRTYPTLESTREPGGIFNHPHCRHRFIPVQM